MEKANNTKKAFIKQRIFLIIATIIYTVIWTAIQGIPLVGIPKVQDVKSVTLTYHGAEEQEISDQKHLEILVDSADLLNYHLMGKAEGEPLVSVCYHLKNGKDMLIEANHTTMWWKGKSHPIKQQDIFVNVTEGIFFPQESSVK